MPFQLTISPAATLLCLAFRCDNPCYIFIAAVGVANPSCSLLAITDQKTGSRRTFIVDVITPSSLKKMAFSALPCPPHTVACGARAALLRLVSTLYDPSRSPSMKKTHGRLRVGASKAHPKTLDKNKNT